MRKRSDIDLVASETERLRIKETLRERQKQKQAIAVEDAKKLKYQGKPEKSVEIAFAALEESRQIFGEKSLEHMPIYFVLAEANLELGRNKKAEEYLVAAHWNLLKHLPSAVDTSKPDETQDEETQQLLDNFKSNLHKSFGQLFKDLGRFQEALREVTSNIFIESKVKGPEHHSLTESYNLMAQIFSKQGKPEEAMSFNLQVTLIWKKFIDECGLLEEIPAKEVEIQGGSELVRKIHEEMSEALGSEHATVVETRHILQGMYDLLDRKRRENAAKASQEE
mmetsp:Transcript_19597/g.36008  ORF Transcript_19597/g.36008 Transcript_19597/m.36008 type:complete len:280 (-) Transcript_19597:71-910(-)